MARLCECQTGIARETAEMQDLLCPPVRRMDLLCSWDGLSLTFARKLHAAYCPEVVLLLSFTVCNIRRNPNSPLQRMGKTLLISVLISAKQNLTSISILPQDWTGTLQAALILFGESKLVDKGLHYIQQIWGFVQSVTRVWVKQVWGSYGWSLMHLHNQKSRDYWKHEVKYLTWGIETALNKGNANFNRSHTSGS